MRLGDDGAGEHVAADRDHDQHHDLATTTTTVPVTYVDPAAATGWATSPRRSVSTSTSSPLLNGITNRDDIEAGEVLEIPPPRCRTTLRHADHVGHGHQA